jgi:hypothetical protein
MSLQNSPPALRASSPTTRFSVLRVAGVYRQSLSRNPHLPLQSCHVVGAPSWWRMKRWASPIPDEVLEELRAVPNASKISELWVNDWSDCPGVLIQLINIWPHIASLKIAGKLPTINNSIHSIFSTISPGPTPCMLTLKTLSLNCATGMESNVDFVKWLRAGSQQTLQRLEFLKEPPRKLLEDILIQSAFPCTFPAARPRLERSFNIALDPLSSLHLKNATTIFSELNRRSLGRRNPLTLWSWSKVLVADLTNQPACIYKRTTAV